MLKDIVSVNTMTDNMILSQNVISRFVDFLDVSANTVRTYKSGIKQLFSFLNKHSINSPDRKSIVAFKKELSANGRKPATIALYLSSVRRFFNWCSSEGIYPDIARGVKAPKQDRGHKRDSFSSQAVRRIMKGFDRSTLEGKRNYALMALMTCGGLRTVEVIRANMEDIRMLGDTTVLYVQGKGRTDKKEFIKVTKPVEEALREYLTARGHVSDNAPLFASLSRRNHGQRLTTRSISGVCKTAMRKAGYDSTRLTAHSLRHTAVTLALTAGQSLSDVQMFARHSNIQTTQIYAHNLERINSLCESSISDAIFA